MRERIDHCCVHHVAVGIDELELLGFGSQAPFGTGYEGTVGVVADMIEFERDVVVEAVVNHPEADAVEGERLDGGGGACSSTPSWSAGAVWETGRVAGGGRGGSQQAVTFSPLMSLSPECPRLVPPELVAVISSRRLVGGARTIVGGRGAWMKIIGCRRSSGPIRDEDQRPVPCRRWWAFHPCPRGIHWPGWGSKSARWPRRPEDRSRIQ